MPETPTPQLGGGRRPWRRSLTSASAPCSSSRQARQTAGGICAPHPAPLGSSGASSSSGISRFLHCLPGRSSSGAANLSSQPPSRGHRSPALSHKVSFSCSSPLPCLVLVWEPADRGCPKVRDSVPVLTSAFHKSEDRNPGSIQMGAWDIPPKRYRLGMIILRREQRREALLDLVISLLPGSPKQGSSATGCVWVCMCETVNESDQPAPDTASSSFQSLESLSQRHFHYFFLPLLPQGGLGEIPGRG